MRYSLTANPLLISLHRGERGLEPVEQLRIIVLLRPNHTVLSRLHEIDLLRVRGGRDLLAHLNQ